MDVSLFLSSFPSLFSRIQRGPVSLFTDGIRALRSFESRLVPNVQAWGHVNLPFTTYLSFKHSSNLILFL